MIKVEFTPEEFIVLVQSLNSRKKIFRGKVNNNRNHLASGVSKLTPEELETAIHKRQLQIEQIGQLQAKLEVIAFRNDLNTKRYEEKLFIAS